MSEYFDTIWPAEHADSARHQFVNVDGLNITGDLQIISNSDLDVPVFSFTRLENELYSIGGTPNIQQATGLNWSFPYIEKLCEASFCDSSYGNAPTFIGENLYMMNNSSILGNPIDPICVLRVNLNDAADYSLLQPFPGTTHGRSLSKMPADPVNNIIFPLDARNGRIGAFTPQFEERWIKEYNTSGIFAGSSTSGEIYINHFDGNNDWFVALDIFDGTELGKVMTPSQTRTDSGFAIGYDNVCYYNGGGHICKVWSST